MYNRCVKIDLKFSSVCEKYQKTAGRRGWFFDSHCRMGQWGLGTSTLILSNILSPTVQIWLITIWGEALQWDYQMELNNVLKDHYNTPHTGKKAKQMIYIAVLCNPKITAEPLYNTPLFIGPYAAANSTALLARRPSQGTKLYCLVNRGTLGVNNLPRVVARIMTRSESNPRPLDHESNALPLHHRVTLVCYSGL